MAVVGAAFTAISTAASAFAASSVGTFLTTNIFGRLLTSVALSALKAAFIGKPKTRQAGIRTDRTQTGGITPASFILGKYATEGQFTAPLMSHGQDGKTPNAYVTYVIELGDIPGQQLSGLILNGEQVELGTEIHADYGTPILGVFTDHAWVKYYDGTQTVADPMLLDKYGDHPDRPWQADMIGAGICYAILTFRYNREIFSGYPTPRFEMAGIPLYDPRLDSSVGGSGTHRWADRTTWEPTENLAVQSYNILRGIDLGGGNIWGGAAEAEDLPLSNWWAEMNKADLAIVLDGGGTEPQWRSSYEVFVDDEPATVLEDLNRGASGKLVENGGIWKTRLGGPGLPLYYFTDEDVVISEPEENTPFSADREPFNGVQAVYPDPAALWEPKDAPGIYNAAYELEDGGQRRVADLRLDATPYPTQVQRVMHAYALDERRLHQHLLNLPPDASMLEPLDVASWSSAANGYIAKDWEISSHVDPLTSGTSQFRMREVDQDDYFWSPDFELPVGYANLNRTPLAEQPVAGFDLRAVAILDADGDARRPALEIIWNGEGQDDVRGILWEVRRTGTTDVRRGSTTDVSEGLQLFSEGILPITSYEARARWVVDRPTQWTDWAEATTGNILFDAKDFDPNFFDQIRADAQEAFENANFNIDFAQDELIEYDLLYRARQIIEDARIEGVVEETRETLAAELANARAEIETIKTTAVSDAAALAQLEQTLTTNLGDVSGEVTTLSASVSTLTDQFSTYQVTVAGQFQAQTAYVNQTFYTKTEADQNIASSIETVETSVNGLTTTVSQVQTSLNGALGQWAIRINNNGVISGISLLSEAVNNIPSSTMIFDADNFYIGTSDQFGNFQPAFYSTNGEVFMDMLMVRDLAVETIHVANNAITLPFVGNGGPLGGDGNWQDGASVFVPISTDRRGNVELHWYVDQGYSNLSASFGVRIIRGSAVIFSRTNMVAPIDLHTSFYEDENRTGEFTYKLQWQGSSSDVNVIRTQLKARLISK